jgi:hypothetical protein
MMALGSAGIWTTVIVVARQDGPEECHHALRHLARVGSEPAPDVEPDDQLQGRVQSRTDSDGPVRYDEARRPAVQFLSNKAA